MDVSWWDDQCGSDFMIETRARSACASETEFANAVLHLQWLASFWKEDTSNVRRNGKIDPNNLWTSLGMMQRRRLSAQTTHKLMYPATDTSVGNKLACYREQLLRYHLDTSVLENETASRKNRKAGDDDAIIIPADSCCDPAATTNTVVYMPCFTGGLQLFVKEDASIEFKLPSWVFDFQTSGTNQYYLSCRVATAHRQEQPISLAIGSTVYEIKLPYTMALWGDTDPVLVTCDEYAGNTLRFTRPKQQFGFAILHIRLIPI